MSDPTAAEPPGLLDHMSYDLNEDYAEYLDKEEDSGFRPSLFDYWQLLSLKLPPRAMLLDPILPEAGLAMLYAERGIGKTMLALGLALAVAGSRPEFLRWKAPKPRNVLYLDGEMPIEDMSSRLRRLGLAQGTPEEGTFQLLSRQASANFPDLTIPPDRDKLLELLEPGSLLVLDNLSTLLPGAWENDAEGWEEMQRWLLELRQKKVAVLMIHHAGKSGDQRGTSRREDILDTVIALQRPLGYRPSDGARFEIHLRKARTVFGEAANPFVAQFICEGKTARWEVSEVGQSLSLTGGSGDASREQRRHEAQALRGQGLSIRQIADKLEISRSAAERLLTVPSRDETGRELPGKLRAKPGGRAGDDGPAAAESE